MLSLSQGALGPLIVAHKFVVANECGILMIVISDLVVEGNLAKTLSKVHSLKPFGQKYFTTRVAT